MIVVGVVGSLQGTARADTTASVDLTNRWSGLTTDSSIPPGLINPSRTFVGTGNTLYSAIVEENASGAAQNSIVIDSRVLVVTVEEPDGNIPTTSTVTASNSNTANGNFNITDLPSGVAVIDTTVPPDNTLTDEVVVTSASGAGSDVGDLTITAVFFSGGLWHIQTFNNVSTAGNTYVLEFNTSEVNTISAKAWSSVDTSATVDLVLHETGVNTGLFEGQILLLDNENASNVNVSATTVSTVAGVRNQATLVVRDGNTVTVEYNDGSPTGGGAALPVRRESRIETSAPTASIDAPIHNSATQVRRPLWSGSGTDVGSGTRITGDGSSKLFIDQDDTAGNAAPVITVGLGAVPVPSSVAAETFSPVFTGSPSNGAPSVAWTFNPGVDMPAPGGTPLTGAIDHQLDFQFMLIDQAGNIGLSDSDVTTTAKNPHVVKIDQTNPAIIGTGHPDLPAVRAGRFFDTNTNTVPTTSSRNTSIQVIFNDIVANVENTDFEVVLPGNITVVPLAVNTYTTSTLPDVVRRSVFLTTDAMPSNAGAAGAALTVRIVGIVTDAAGNSTSAGSALGTDFISPVLTVAVSDGSGTGAAGSSTGPSKLTKSNMVITVTSDEALGSAPAINIFAGNNSTTAETTVPAIAQGGNVYRGQYSGSAATDSSTDNAHTKSVVVSGTDSTGMAPTRTVGNADETNSSAITFRLDKTAPQLNADPDGDLAAGQTTSQRRPFVVIGFTDNSTVTVTKAEVGTTNVLSQLGTSDNKVFIYNPPADLALGATTVRGKATDAAGNEGPEGTYTLTVVDRAQFTVRMFPGFNPIGFPSDPVTNTLASVFAGSGVNFVATYEARNPSNPWQFAEVNATTGQWATTATNALNSIVAGRGYWARSTNFADVKTLLQGPTLPGAGSPPVVGGTPLARGWNFVAAKDQSRGNQTTGTGGVVAGNVFQRPVVGGTMDNVQVGEFLIGVSWARALRYNPQQQTFIDLFTGNDLFLGEGIWVNILPNVDGTIGSIN
jgi:hypothetical protein